MEPVEEVDCATAEPATRATARIEVVNMFGRGVWEGLMNWEFELGRIEF